MDQEDPRVRETRDANQAGMIDALRAGDSTTADRIWRWELAPQVRAAKEERAKKLVGQEDLVGGIERLLFEEDPVNINFEVNLDEYRPEAETITLRLREASTEPELLPIVHQEFVAWFGEDVAGPMIKYERIASAIWEFYSQRQTSD